MAEELRSVEMHRAYRDAQDRFDSFVLGALLAAAGYLAQSNPYAPLGRNPETLFFASLASLVVAIYFGFRRVEYVIVGYRINSQLLHAYEHRRPRGVQAARSVLDRIVKPKAKGAYVARNFAMLFAIALYMAARLWQAYLPH